MAGMAGMAGSMAGMVGMAGMVMERVRARLWRLAIARAAWIRPAAATL
jgi:hypothetical protein